MDMKTEYRSIKYETADRVATVTMCVPEKMNALDARLGEELASALARVKADAAVKVVVLTGMGKAFCAGGDVTAFEGVGFQEAVEGIKAASKSLVGAFMSCPKPIVASVNGFAVGAGLSMALLSDIVIASDQAVFGAAFVNIGLTPDCGSLYLLPRLVGLPKAKEMVFTGRNIDAREALNLGIVNQVAEHDKLAEVAAKTAARLAAQPSLSMAQSKALIHMGLDIGIDELLDMEAVAQGMCMVSEDGQEGVGAFLHKRKPNFK
ncbi:MAG: enoyl-CoA hydratase/isomerase family protein [Gracilibacteraceae bacterium]|jgi:2-(1,2-epoxy-1,2-dihydrophenyl)acetyl-CoA isomerase|nr:enoyl-CoA hydratase/isomerase family protein [Gracilibacteraceae bacterium]